MAISTLRTKRSRPMRLTGVLANACGRPRRRAAPAPPAAARAVVARGELRLAALRELVPRAHRQAVVAAVDAVAHQRRGIRAGSGPCARWSGRRCSAAHRAGRAPGKPRSGRRRGRPGRCRSDPLPARRAADSSVVKIAPRNSHEPNSRDTRLVCLPCQPRPAAAAERLLHHRRGVDEHLHVAAGLRDQPARQRLQPGLDDVVIVARPGRRPRSRRGRGARGSSADRGRGRNSSRA